MKQLLLWLSLLRRQPAQARIDGREPFDSGWKDYAVVEDTVIGRICKEIIHGEGKWLWFLQQVPEAGPGRPIPPPNQERPRAWRRRRRHLPSVMRR